MMDPKIHVESVIYTWMSNMLNNLSKRPWNEILDHTS
jgi:hypothetical protein